MGPPPLRWAPEHPVVLDGEHYHRVWCPEHHRPGPWSFAGWYVAAGEPLPPDGALHACPVCRPELVLTEDPRRRRRFLRG